MPGSIPPIGYGSMPPHAPGWRPPSSAAFVPQQYAVLPAPLVRLQSKPDPRLVLLTDPDGARSVSFRLLRDNLLSKRLPRVLAVTSPVKKDGKTTCALNLALSLSEGARVLLVEGNLQEPQLAQIFGIDDAVPSMPNMPWLGNYKVVELSPTFHVSAPSVRTLPQRFDKTWFEQLFGSFRRFNYNFIVIDCAALEDSPTMAQLIGMADATLLAVRSGVTTARSLRRASEQIPTGRGIGVALIDAKLRP